MSAVRYEKWNGLQHAVASKEKSSSRHEWEFLLQVNGDGLSKLFSEFGCHLRTPVLQFSAGVSPPTMRPLTKELSPLPVVIQASPEEVSNGELTWKNLERAVRALHRDGLVVLEDVIEYSKLDMLNKKMVEDALTLQARGDDSPYNYNKG